MRLPKILYITVKLLLLVNLLCVNDIKQANCLKNDFYSSSISLEDLLQTEVVLLKDLEDYINNLQQHLDVLQSEIADIKVEHLAAFENTESYLNNPVNAFRLIKRLYNDWPSLEEAIETETSQTNYLKANIEHKQNLRYPSVDDFLGSAIALTRLQETYQLNVAELSNNILNGVKYGTPMSWQDCYVLGEHLFALHDYNHTVPWFQQSMLILSQSEYGKDTLSLDFMEAVADYQREMGDYENSLNLLTYILTIEPQRSYLYDKKLLLEQLVSDGVKSGYLHESVSNLTNGYHQTKEFSLYEQVCREELKMTPTQHQRQLYCYYHNNNIGFRLLQPFKIEELFLDPLILQFYDVLSDKDIETVQRIAKPRMKRSKVRAVNGSEDVVMSYRTSQSAGFDYTKHPVFMKMSTHISDLSGLNMKHAEELQVANYGIGGHYEPHLDCFADDQDYVDSEEGNRLATAIYYLSDVTEGGGTAFPFLNLLVKPKQGSVLFWYNLHSSGDIDYRTKHAACPVLTGSKWIANVWIRLRNQDHIRPCQLQRDNEISLPYKDFN